MTSGNTITQSLADSLPSVRQSARVTREYGRVMTGVADKVTLGEGVGLTWNEVTLAQLTATSITETTVEDNPQQITDTLFSLTPTVVSVQTIITDRTARRISKNVFAKTGGLAQQAIERKKDQDGLAIFDGATSSQPGAGSTLASGVISAAAANIRSNTTEPWDGPIAAVLHGFQRHDLYTELVAGVGTYPIPAGPTAEVFKGQFNLPIAEAVVMRDDLITIDASADAKGGVFASGKGGALVVCQGRSAWTRVRERPEIGGDATEMFHRDEYAWGERSAGNWLWEIYSDATAPTS